jgi:hypothetical protein
MRMSWWHLAVASGVLLDTIPPLSETPIPAGVGFVTTLAGWRPEGVRRDRGESDDRQQRHQGLQGLENLLKKAHCR